MLPHLLAATLVPTLLLQELVTISRTRWDTTGCSHLIRGIGAPQLPFLSIMSVELALCIILSMEPITLPTTEATLSQISQQVVVALCPTLRQPIHKPSRPIRIHTNNPMATMLI
jgi:hypothetical protein